MNYLIIVAALFALVALKLTKVAVMFVLAGALVFLIARSSFVKDFFGKKK